MTRKTQARRADLRPTMDATGEPPREGQTFAGQSLLVRYVNFVKLPHTVFALPFALLGVVYASTVAAVTTVKVGLVIVAFTAARFAAMGFNRIVDREADARNPRTRDRELPAGRLSVRAAGAAVTGGAAVFVVASGLLNRVCSHFWLGAALAIAPVGGYLAIAGAWSKPAWTLLVLALAVAAWVGGFDVFYALQDEEFDRQHGLKSAIVALGRSRAILAAKLAHGLTIALLVGFGAGAGLGAAYYVGIVVAAVLLVWEHRLVKPDDLSRLDAAFFTMNGVMSIVVFLGALADRVI
ncbi:MAG: UbiA family prenyltransferase [Gemmatimonadetes bacterium]|nr:UbiA family prenyltransferase [Gemmatimonadota bacterium]